MYFIIFFHLSQKVVRFWPHWLHQWSGYFAITSNHEYYKNWQCYSLLLQGTHVTTVRIYVFKAWSIHFSRLWSLCPIYVTLCNLPLGMIVTDILSHLYSIVCHSFLLAVQVSWSIYDHKIYRKCSTYKEN